MPGSRSGSRPSGDEPPRVTFHVEGGFGHFPGLAQPREIDATTLAAADVATLRSLAEGPAAGERSSGAAPRGADCRTYVIAVEHGGRRRTVTLRDPVEDPALARLVAGLSQAQRRAVR